VHLDMIAATTTGTFWVSSTNSQNKQN
jgi:hypothetical protein